MGVEVGVGRGMGSLMNAGMGREVSGEGKKRGVDGTQIFQVILIT